MSLSPGTDRTRQSLLVDALAQWLKLKAAPLTSGYALIVFEDEKEISVRVRYPAEPEAILTAARNVEPWGTSPIGAAVEYALLYARTVAPTGAARLILVTDGEDTAHHLDGQEETPAQLTTARASLSLITLDDDRPGVSEALTNWVARSGGEIVAVAAEGLRSSQIPAEPSVPSGNHELSGASDPDVGTVSQESVARALAIRILSAWLVVAKWNFLVASLVGLAAVILAIIGWRRRVDATAAHNAQPTRVLLEARSSTGDDTFEINRFPASVGTASRCSIYLGKAAGKKRGSFSLALGRNGLLFSAASPLHVNGVPRRDWTVTEGDQIRIDRYRVVVSKVISPTPLPDPPPRFLRTIPVPAMALFATFLIFILRPFGGSIVTTPVGILARAPVVPVEQAASPAEEVGDVAPGVVQTPLSRDAQSPVLIAPGESPAFFDADYLAIHAHPDDESLDLGILLARLSSDGLRGVVVLMTDGQSGRDQYPRREVSGIYAGYDMTGGQLVRARVTEALSAMTLLGVSEYIRLGLPNHPYNSLDDELSPEQVITRWGGRNDLVRKVAQLIGGFSPELLITPDGPAGSYEHFEHEATGIVAREALAALQSAGDSPVRAHLVAVDPLQREAYDRLIALSPWETDPRTGESFRSVQLRALSEHKTQRDASVVGVETRLAVPAEFYAVAYWDPDFSPPRALGIAESPAALSAMVRP